MRGPSQPGKKPHHWGAGAFDVAFGHIKATHLHNERSLAWPAGTLQHQGWGRLTVSQTKSWTFGNFPATLGLYGHPNGSGLEIDVARTESQPCSCTWGAYELNTFYKGGPDPFMGGLGGGASQKKRGLGGGSPPEGGVGGGSLPE